MDLRGGMNTMQKRIVDTFRILMVVYEPNNSEKFNDNRRAAVLGVRFPEVPIVFLKRSCLLGEISRMSKEASLIMLIPFIEVILVLYF